MFRLFSTVVGNVEDAGIVKYETSCVVPDDPGAIVRHARPLDDRARQQLREQHISRLVDASRPGRRSRDVAAIDDTRAALLEVHTRDRRYGLVS